MPKPIIPGELLAAIVARLRAPIPHRPKPKPKARASWQGLLKGDKLTRAGGAMIWEVEGCDSGGAYLRVVTPYRGNTALYITDPRDLEALAKVAKPRTRSRKGPKGPQEEHPSGA